MYAFLDVAVYWKALYFSPGLWVLNLCICLSNDVCCKSLYFSIQGCVSEGPRKVKEAHIPEGWPQMGSITFQDYQMRYRENTPIVLNGLNLNIQSREKIGIVGRTGSGGEDFYSSWFFITTAICWNWLTVHEFERQS